MTIPERMVGLPVHVIQLGYQAIYGAAVDAAFPRRLAAGVLRRGLPFVHRFAPARPQRVPQTAGGAGRARQLAVVIVTYQSAAVVADCLATLPAALGGDADARVIVVDNASTDHTLDIVAATAPDAEVIRQPANAGFAAGVNAGMAAAADCDVLVLNPDIRLLPGSVHALRAVLAEPGAGIAVPRFIDPDGPMPPALRCPHTTLRRRPTVLRALGEAVLGGVRAGRVPALGEMVVDAGSYARPGAVDWATGAAWLVSRDCADEIGTLDERYFLYSEETDYMLRVTDSGWQVRYTPDALVVHLGGEQQSSAWLWALSVTNRVRLHRERHGRAAAVLMWFAVTLGELIRAGGKGWTGGVRHRAALRALLWMARWPRRPDHAGADQSTGTQSGVVCLSAQDERHYQW